MTTLAVAEPYIVQFLEDYSDKAPGCMTFETDFDSRLSIQLVMMSDRPLFLHAPLPPEYRLRLETLLVERGVKYGYDTEWAKSKIVQADLPRDARVIADLIDSILESVFDVADESSINVSSFETD